LLQVTARECGFTAATFPATGFLILTLTAIEFVRIAGSLRAIGGTKKASDYRGLLIHVGVIA
jgi:hypothetical protein